MRLAAALTALLVTLPAARALACTCVQQTPEEAFARASAVFEGRVVASERVGPADVGPARVRVTFRVTQAWKGVAHETITVWTTDSSATCGIPFEVGRAYLVYGSGDAAQASTGMCSGTKRIEEAADAIAALGAGVVPVDVTDSTPRPVAPSAHGSRGGCAGCAVARGKTSGGVAGALAAAALTLRRRRRGP